MRSCFVLISTAVLCICAGCQGDTGIVVAVSGQDVQELEFVVGVERDGALWLDRETTGQRADVSGRSLRSAPYRLLLREPDNLGTPLRVRPLVLGRITDQQGSRVVAIAVMEPPQTFIQGEMLRRTVALRQIGGSTTVSVGKRCYTARVGENQYRWISETNRDCDPSTTADTPRDCDDTDPTVYPGAPERCDGRDNDCDGQLGPVRASCYGRTETGDGFCHVGSRICEVGEGSGAGSCELLAEPAPEAYCAQFASDTCASLANGAACARGNVLLQQRVCTLQRQEGGGFCTGGSVTLAPPVADATDCHWRIVSDAGYRLSFAGATGDAQSVDSCQATLQVEADLGGPTGAPVVLEFFVGATTGWVTEVDVAEQIVAACEPAPLVCSGGTP